jgi:hypothetical protein
VTIEALSLTLCMASGIFGRPAWTPEKCQERAMQISEIAKQDDLDPLLFVAINIQECDMRESVSAKFFAPAVGRHKPKVLGIDACPMGIRIHWPNSKQPPKLMDALALYEIAGKKMRRWKRWCERHHRGHHFVSHWNEGNETYAAQVLAFRATLAGQPVKNEAQLTDRTIEIVRRLRRAQRERRS